MKLLSITMLFLFMMNKSKCMITEGPENAKLPANSNTNHATQTQDIQQVMDRLKILANSNQDDKEYGEYLGELLKTDKIPITEINKILEKPKVYTLQEIEKELNIAKSMIELVSIEELSKQAWQNIQQYEEVIPYFRMNSNDIYIGLLKVLFLNESDNIDNYLLLVINPNTHYFIISGKITRDNNEIQIIEPKQDDEINYKKNLLIATNEIIRYNLLKSFSKINECLTNAASKELTKKTNILEEHNLLVRQHSFDNLKVLKKSCHEQQTRIYFHYKQQAIINSQLKSSKKTLIQYLKAKIERAKQGIMALHFEEFNYIDIETIETKIFTSESNIPLQNMVYKTIQNKHLKEKTDLPIAHFMYMDSISKMLNAKQEIASIIEKDTNISSQVQAFKNIADKLKLNNATVEWFFKDMNQLDEFQWQERMTNINLIITEGLKNTITFSLDIDINEIPMMTLSIQDFLNIYRQCKTFPLYC